MAQKKAGGSTRLGRDSQPQYLGAKVGDGETVNSGQVLIRQRGTKIHPGKNVKKAKMILCIPLLLVKSNSLKEKRYRFDGSLKMTKFINVI